MSQNTVSYRKSLQRQNGSTAPQNTQSVLLILLIEDQPTRQAYDPGLDSLCLEFPSRLDGDADLATTTDDGQILVRLFMHDIPASESALDGRAFEVGQVLSGKRQDRRSFGGMKGSVVRRGSLVTVGGTPESEVRDGTEVDSGFNRLMRRSVLTKTDGIVRS